MTSQAFYSQLSRAVADAPDKVFGRAEQVKSWLQANASKLGVKQDEIVWSGIVDWLDLQEGRVGKEQVLDYLNANGVQVTETMLEEGSSPTEGWVAIRTNPYEDNWVVRDSQDRFIGIAYDVISDEAAIEQISTESRINNTKYSKYTVPGGENYKELLLTLPRKELTTGDIAQSLFGMPMENLDEDERKDVADKLRAMGGLSNKDYRSSHFDQANILAHVRFDERADADGNKVLFIHELQSDWSSEGRKKGFIANNLTEHEKELQILNGFTYKRDLTQAEKERHAELKKIGVGLTLLEKVKVAGSTPRAPFVEKTESYLTLVLKRMMSYAAENGFDKVAIINGQQAADLYDLSKQVDSVNIKPSNNGEWILSAYDQEGGRVMQHFDVPMDKLEDYIGKVAAKNLLAKETNSFGQKELTGADLKVGGEGMRTFYDSIVPQVAKEVLKKLGGSKVDAIKLPSLKSKGQLTESVYGMNQAYSDLPAASKARIDDMHANLAQSQTSFTITPDMRSKILNEGLPLFSQDIGNYSQGLSIDLIDAEIARFKLEWPAIPDVTVVQSVDMLPFEAPVNADGAYYDGKVYVVADNIVDIKQLQKVMAHECVLHHSLQEMLGDYGFSKLHAGIQSLKASGDPTVVSLAANILERYGVLPPEVETKEIIARAGELCLDDTGNVRIEYGFMKSVYAGVAGWLRDQGFKVAFTNVELQGIMHDAGEWIKRDVEREYAGSLAPVMSLGGASLVEESMIGALTDNLKGYSNYEKDLFGNNLSNKNTGLGDSENTNDTSTKAISHTGDGYALDTIAPDAEYYVNTFIGVTASKKLGASKVLTSEHLAQATYYLNKSAVERMDGLVTDKDGNPLAVIGGFKGATTQSAVYPATLMAEAVRIPNAANLWLSHNHPSGKAELSRSDVALYGQIKNVFDGSGIDVMSLIAVAKDEYASIDKEGESNFQPIPASNTASIVPVIERELQDDGVRHGVVSSPAAAKAIASSLHAKANQNGVILNDAQNRVVAWLPLSDALTGQLKNTGALNGLYRAISQSNAVSAIIVHDGSLAKPAFENGQSPIENIGKALSNIDVNLLDAINVKDKSSYAERGDNLVGKVLFSRNDSTLHGTFAGDITITSSSFENISLGNNEVNGRATVHAHDVQGKQVGFLSLYRSEVGLEIGSVDVTNDYRRQGIGRVLVETALKIAGHETVFTTLHTPLGKKLFSSFGLDKPGLIKSAIDFVVSGSFSGRVLDVANGVVVQKIGRDPDTVVRHDVLKLNNVVKIGDVVDIKYKNGHASVFHKNNEISR